MNTLNEKNIRRVKLACYTTNISMSVITNLPPILFLTFRSLYGLSYSLVGLLVLVNYLTQLSVDLVFSFFSHKFNIPKTVKLTPVLTFSGLLIYALWPFVFPQNVFLGLVIGTVVFSASGGLAEVLISPVIAALPAKDPDREMSKLHSIYAWGVIPVIIISTMFIRIFGARYWQWLILLFIAVPLCSAMLFSVSEIPQMETPEKVSGALNLLKDKTLWLCVGAIFLGGATECTMSQWASGYCEQALGIPKVMGDVFGVTLFAFMLGTGRTLYAKMGKNVEKILLAGAVGAAVCYFICAVAFSPVAGLVACALTGLCVSMLWPGSLVVASDRFPKGGVFIYAMMAAGGDFGASVGPQLVGVITDTVMRVPSMVKFSETLAITPEQLGMKAGMLLGMIFPLCAIPVYTFIVKTKNKNAK